MKIDRRVYAFAALLAVAATAACGMSADQTDSAPNHHARRSSTYHLVWTHTLSVNADSAATIDPAVRFKNGSKAAVAYVLAGNNDSDCDPSNAVHAAVTYAFKIGGHLLWKKSTSGKGRCTTSAPAYSGAWVYSPGLDGRIHKYNAATGSEYKKHGWPIRFTKQPYVEKASAALRVNGPYLYLTTSGFDGDQGHYEGHVVTVNLSTNHVNVWNSLCSHIRGLIDDKPGTADYCSSAQNGMFGRGQAVVDPLDDDIYVVTGNGPWNGKTNWGDSILKLNPAGSKLLDAFTPTNQQYLNDNDLDLGSTAPGILPPISAHGKTWHLLTQGGKGPAGTNGGPAVIWLVNRDRMGPRSGPGHLGGQLDTIPSPGGAMVLTAPAVWVNAQGNPIVIYGDDSGLTGYRVDTAGAAPKLVVAWSVSGRATTPVVAGNNLFVGRDGEVDELNPANGSRLWSSADAGSGGTIGSLHWEYPAVFGTWLLMTDENGKLYAYEK